MSNEFIEVKCNDKELFEVFEALCKRVKNMKPIMREITHIMLEDIEENFETEGENANGKWEDWSDDWKEKRIKLGRGEGKILTLNADLRKSFVREASNTEALVGTNKEYAAIHNFGGEIKKNFGR